MPRSPRVISEHSLYEITPRAREGLPLPPTKTTNEILSGILARVQRDDKVTLTNYIWMNNHAHLHVLPSDAYKLPLFYCELQKKVTDSVRTLLGKKSLRIWEDRTGVMLVANLETAIDRLAYLFCNPAKSGLVDSIDLYPGLSSWKAFCSCPPSVDAEVSITALWHPVSSLPKLPPGRTLSESQDSSCLTQLQGDKDAVKHTLTIKPLAWLAAYGITEEKEIERIRQEVIALVRDREAGYREERRISNTPVIGVKMLKRQEYYKAHQPKKKTRKVFVLCSDKELRIALIVTFKSIFTTCRECYQNVKKGIAVIWPKGTFIPWLPPNSCCNLL